MRRFSLPLGVIATACALLTGSPTAYAAAQTWVSGTGTDTGNCQIAAPCKTFAFAQSKTGNRGSINVLSSGNFGPVTITKAISIIARGEVALVNPPDNGDAIAIQARAEDVVLLEGLTINVTSNFSNGISFISGKSLHVQNCIIRDGGFGIEYVPSTGTSELFISDTAVVGSSAASIFIRPSGNASVLATLNRVRAENSTGGNTGVIIRGTDTTGSVKGTVRDSVSAGHGSAGLEVSESGTGTTAVSVDRTALVNNSFGVSVSGAGATVRIGDSTVSGNSTGFITSSGGVIESYGTNNTAGNVNRGSTTPITPD